MFCSCDPSVSLYEKVHASHAKCTRASLMGLCSPDEACHHQQCSSSCRTNCIVTQSASRSSHETTMNQMLASSLHRVNLPVDRRQALLLEEGIGLGEVLTSKESLHRQASHEQPSQVHPRNNLAI